MQLHTCLLPLILIVGCAGDAAEEIDPVCLEAAELLERCSGGAPDEFFASCAADPAGAEDLIAAECPPGSDKSDGWLGWKDRGERCWFNWECSDDLVCRPLELRESSDTACMETGEELGPASAGQYCGDWCDDDDDCAPGLLCRNERNEMNGMCVSVDHPVYHQVYCSAELDY